MGNNQVNFQLHRFTRRDNTAKSLGGILFLTHTVCMTLVSVLVHCIACLLWWMNFTVLCSNLLLYLVDNGFNPVWNEVCEFDILNPEVAMMRIVVQDEDVFGDPNFLGQATIPVKCLRTGRPCALLC